MANYIGTLKIQDKAGAVQGFCPRTTPALISSQLGNASLAADITSLNTALANSDLSGCLPLAGGLMTGRITRQNSAGTRTASIFENGNDDLDENIDIGWEWRAADDTDGALLGLRNADNATMAGEFELLANGASTGYMNLKGKPSGSLVKIVVNSAGVSTTSAIATTDTRALYLPLAGGTMTGAVTTKGIASSQTAALYRDGDASYLDVVGGTSGKGAWMRLGGPNRSGNPGGWYLIARDGSSAKYLEGKVDGTLTWGTDGGSGAIPIAMVSDLPAYLPLSGGTMTGNITVPHIIAAQGAALYRNADNSELDVSAGKANKTGAYLALVGPTNSTDAGMFALHAKDGSTDKALRGYTDGRLTWGGTSVAVGSFLPLSGGTVTGNITSTRQYSSFSAKHGTDGWNIALYFSSNLTDRGIYDHTVGAYLLNWNSAGRFLLRAANEDYSSHTDLTGTAAGVLQWDGNTVLTSDSTVAAGNVSGTVSAATTVTKLNSSTATSGSTSTTVSIARANDITTDFVLPSGGTWVVLRIYSSTEHTYDGQYAKIGTYSGGATVAHTLTGTWTRMTVFGIRVA